MQVTAESSQHPAARTFTLGCASTPTMPVLSGPSAAPGSPKPIYLLSVSLRNSLRPDYQLRMSYLGVYHRMSAASDRKFAVEIDPPGTLPPAPDLSSRYLVRLELDPGKYTMHSLISFGSVPFFKGFFATPLHADIDVAAPGVYYLGHVEAIVRERVGNEFTAGPPMFIPLLGQALTQSAVGATTGTFDVAFSDRFGEDEPLFRDRFPALKNASITKSLLPPFDRARAQKWWEENNFMLW